MVSPHCTPKGPRHPALSRLAHDTRCSHPARGGTVTVARQGWAQGTNCSAVAVAKSSPNSGTAQGGTGTHGHRLRAQGTGAFGSLIPLAALAELCLVRAGWGVMPDTGGSKVRMCPVAWLGFHSLVFHKTNAIAGHPSSGARVVTPAESSSASHFFPARGCSLTAPLPSSGSLPTAALGSSAAISCHPSTCRARGSPSAPADG